MQFNIVWTKGVRLTFAPDLAIRDEYMPIKAPLIQRLQEYDYVSFMQFFNEIKSFIGGVFANNLLNKNLTPMVKTCGNNEQRMVSDAVSINSSDINSGDSVLLSGIITDCATGKHTSEYSNSVENSSDDDNYNARHPAVCDGICNCIGDCGNTLIRAAILFYNSLIASTNVKKLDPKLFNGKTRTIHNQEQMWESLVSVFNDNYENEVNEEKENENSKEELLIDLMCLVDLMARTVPQFAKNLSNPTINLKKSTIFDKVEKMVSKMRQQQRVKRISRYTRSMFKEFGKHLNTDQLKINADNDAINAYSLTQFIRAVCLHNYGMNDYIGSGLQNVQVNVSNKMYIESGAAVGNAKGTVDRLTRQVTNAFVLELTLEMASKFQVFGDGIKAATTTKQLTLARMVILVLKTLKVRMMPK